AVERAADRPDRALLVRPAPHPAAHCPGPEADAGGLRGDAFDRDVFHSTSSLHASGLRSPSGAGSALMAVGSTRGSARNHTCFSLVRITSLTTRSFVPSSPLSAPSPPKLPP